MEQFSYKTNNGLTIGATFYKHSDEYLDKNNPLIIYLHGGGLIYGSREDLPTSHIEKLTNHGYSILALDYPLIPESSINEIIDALISGINWGIKEFSINQEFILFGRSAGAYLTLLLSSRFLTQKPKAVISLYGYFDLHDKNLSGENAYYKKYPLITDEILTPLIGTHPIFNALIEQRFPIYLSYRQRGVWLEKILNGQPIDSYSLTDEDIQKLPPLFIAASKDDEDVPYSQSERLADLSKQSDFLTVTALPHDFDRFVEDEQTQSVYEQLIKWLQSF